MTTKEPKALKKTICIVGYAIEYLTTAFMNAKESVLKSIKATALKKEEFNFLVLFFVKVQL
mgnify:FL=1